MLVGVIHMTVTMGIPVMLYMVRFSRSNAPMYKKVHGHVYDKKTCRDHQEF